MGNIMTLRGVSKYFISAAKQKKYALKGVDLVINQGEVLGLLGVNGAGKTTLSSIIGGLIPASAGSVQFHDTSIYDNPAAYRAQVGFCPQRANFNPYLTMEQNLYYAGTFFGLAPKHVNERVRLLSHDFDCTDYLQAYVNELSGGYKQRFLFIRSLLHSPKILILDEPTVALDPQVRRQLWLYIKKLRAEGLAIILTTHYLEEAEELSDRVSVLDKGVVRLTDTPENLKLQYQKNNLEAVFIALLQEDCD